MEQIEMLRFAHTKDKLMIEHDTNPGVAFILSFQEQLQLAEYLETNLKERKAAACKSVGVSDEDAVKDPWDQGVVGKHKYCGYPVSYNSKHGYYTCANWKCGRLVFLGVAQPNEYIDFHPDYSRAK